MRATLPLLVIAGHVALCLLAWRLGFTGRRPVASSDPQTAFGGLFLLYWSVVLALAWRRQDHNWLFRFLNARGLAPFGALLCGVIGIGLLVIGLGAVVGIG